MKENESYVSIPARKQFAFQNKRDNYSLGLVYNCGRCVTHLIHDRL